jgi:hypothetical protein
MDHLAHYHRPYTEQNAPMLRILAWSCRPKPLGNQGEREPALLLVRSIVNSRSMAFSQ